MTTAEDKIKIIPVSSKNESVQKLITKLDQYQLQLYSACQCNLESADVLEKNGAFIAGAFSDDILIGIGAIKFFETYAEIKRMFVEEDFRGTGVAEKILTTLEMYAKEKGIEKINLETGNKHHAALRFYKRLGYGEVERFGNHIPNDVSVYFEKAIRGKLST